MIFSQSDVMNLYPEGHDMSYAISRIPGTSFVIFSVVDNHFL